MRAFNSRKFVGFLAFFLGFGLSNLVHATGFPPQTKTEKQIQQTLEAQFYSSFIDDGFLERMMSERGLDIASSEKALKEMSRGMSMCALLGLRLTPADMKAQLGSLIRDGDSNQEVRKRLTDFISGKSSGQDDEASDDPAKDFLSLVKSCMTALQESPIQDPDGNFSTDRVPHSYALDSVGKKIYYNGRSVYGLGASGLWEFTCVKADNSSRRESGTNGHSGFTRIITVNCATQKDLYHGAAIGLAGWVTPDSDAVHFVFSNGPGGSSSNIAYKVISFHKGGLITTGEQFRSGEYFRILVTQNCSAFVNEHDLSERVVLDGNCTDLASLIGRFTTRQNDSYVGLENGGAAQFFDLEKPDWSMSYVYALKTPFYDLGGADGTIRISKSTGIEEINWESKNLVGSLPKFAFFSEKETTVGVLKGSAGASGGSGQAAYFFDTESGRQLKIETQNLNSPDWILEDGLPTGVRTQRWNSLGPRAFSLGYAPRTDKIYIFKEAEENLVRSIQEEEKLFESKLTSISFSEEDLSELSKPFFDIDRTVGEKLMDFIYYSVRTNNSEAVDALLMRINPSDLLREEVEFSMGILEEQYGSGNQ